MSTLEWIREECPVIFWYGPSGVGKTQLAGTLFNDDIYWPVLYLDLDEGAKTIADIVKNPKKCDYRSKTQRPKGMDVFEFAGRVMLEAETSHHGAMIIEGLTKFRDNLAGRWKRMNAEKLKTPRGNMHAYQEASSLTSALFTGISDIQDVRKQAGEGMPIVGTFNTVEKRKEIQGGPVLEWLEPKLSANLNEDIMSRCDVFAELRREPGMPLRIIAERGKLNVYRKARNPAVAKALGKLADPQIDAIFDTWAEVERKQLAAATATDEPENTNEPQED